MKWWPFQRKADDGSLNLFREIYGGRTSKAGQVVTLESALRCAAVLACARVISQAIAQVPLKLFQGDDAGGKKPAIDHPLYWLLYRKPNPWQTSFELRETLGLHLAVMRRAYVFKTMVGGRIRELIPLPPDKVETKLADDGLTVLYKFTGHDGRTVDIDASLIWHIKGASWCGWEGMPGLDLAREVIGLSIATETAHAKLYANGVQPSGVYSVEGNLNPAQYDALRNYIAKNYAGENSGTPMIVDRAAKWLSTAMSGKESQHLETRKHQVVEVCREMGVMPIMVFEYDNATTFASSENMFQAHVVHTCAPWWERLEQSIDCNVLTDADIRSGIYSKFIGQALLRGSMKDRADYFSKALGAGGSPAWMSQDEVRGLEEMNPMGGDAARLPIATNVPKPAPPPPPAGA